MTGALPRRLVTLLSRSLGTLTIAAFLAIAYTPLANWLSARSGTPSAIEKCDAAVVLGKSMLPQGTLADASLRRAVTAIALERTGFARYLLFLGNDRESGRDEAHVRADLALRLGVPSESILVDSSGTTTLAESQVARKWLEPRGIRRILLVTDSQHMTRAARLFRAQGFIVFPAVSDEFPNPAHDGDDRFDLMHRVVVEAAARGYQGLTTWRK